MKGMYAALLTLSLSYGAALNAGYWQGQVVMANSGDDDLVSPGDCTYYVDGQETGFFIDVEHSVTYPKISSVRGKYVGIWIEYDAGSPGLCYRANLTCKVHNWGGFGSDTQGWGSAQYCVPTTTTTPPRTGTFQPSEFCPLILDLNGDGIHTTDHFYDPVAFYDPDGDGALNPGGWTDPGTEEAFVWIDVDGNGLVRPGELAGSKMILPDGSAARNGFQVLQVFDRLSNGGNEDGEISQEDRIFHKLRLWVDRNHDGISQEDEVGALPSRGIVSIGTAFQHVHRQDGRGNVVMLAGTYTRRHGQSVTVMQAEDVGFAVRRP